MKVDNINHFIIDGHTSYCQGQYENLLKNRAKHKKETDDEHTDWIYDTLIRAHEINNNFVFFLNNDFYLISYHHCFEDGWHLDFKVDLIKQVLKKYKIYPYYQVSKSNEMGNDLNDFRKRGVNLRNTILEINYTYGSYSKEYAITTKANYMDRYVLQNELENNFEKMKTYFENNGYSHYINELKNLYELNKINCQDEAINVKTVDELVKLINKQIN